MPIVSTETGEIPAHLNRWNWGAFLLNWIWGIGNSVWIALLCLIPGVNIVMMFVLGARGSRWAWENRAWRDEEHFRRTQRNWAIAGVLAWLTIPALTGGIVFGVLGALKNSEAYTLAMDAVRQNPSVQAALGENIETGFFTSGSIKLNGPDGIAALQIPLKGARGRGAAHVRAIRQAGAWQLVLLVVRVAGQAEPIVIINRDNLPIAGSPLET